MPREFADTRLDGAVVKLPDCPPISPCPAPAAPVGAVLSVNGKQASRRVKWPSNNRKVMNSSQRREMSVMYLMWSTCELVLRELAYLYISSVAVAFCNDMQISD